MSSQISEEENSETTGMKKLRILLFGATGPTGRRLLEQALQQGHQVTAVVRSPEKLDDVKESNLRLHKGDACNKATFQECMAETDVVVSCLGSHDKRSATVSLYSKSAQEIHDAMKSNNIGRLVALTSWGTKDNPNMSFFVRWILKPLFIGHILADMERMEEYIEKTDLNYTIVRPPGLSNSPLSGKECKEAENEVYVPGAAQQMPRADVAAFMLRCLQTDKYDKKILSIGFA